MRDAKIFCAPPTLRASRGWGQNLNHKFKTFGFLDSLKVNHTLYTIHHTLYSQINIQGLLSSLHQTKLAEKKPANFYFQYSSLFRFRFEKL